MILFCAPACTFSLKFKLICGYVDMKELNFVDVAIFLEYFVVALGEKTMDL